MQTRKGASIKKQFQLLKASRKRQGKNQKYLKEIMNLCGPLAEIIHSFQRIVRPVVQKYFHVN